MQQQVPEKKDLIVVHVYAVNSNEECLALLESLAQHWV